MKRLILVLPLVLLSVAVFGQGKELAGVDPTGAKITFWYQHSGARDTAMKGMIADFNATNPWKIAVTGEYQGGYDQVHNKMLAAITARNPPDLVVGYQQAAAMYMVNDAIVDLNTYVKDPKWGLTTAEYSDFVEGFINQDVSPLFGGKRLGFPPNRSVEVMYYNLSWLKAMGWSAPPKTWDEFYEMCKKATNKEKGTYGYAIDTDASRFYTLVISRGGDTGRSDGKGYIFTIPQARDAMAFMKKLYDDGYGKKLAKAYDDQTDFGNYLCLFTIGSTSGLPYYGDAVKAGKGGAFDWSIAAPPTTTGKPTLDLYGASVSIPKTTPQRQLAAWLFVKWFSEPKQQAKWTEISSYFPVRKSAAALLTDYLAKDPKFATAWNLLNSSTLKTEPSSYPGYELVRDKVKGAYNSILDGANIDETLQKLETEANKILKDSAP